METSVSPCRFVIVNFTFPITGISLFTVDINQYIIIQEKVKSRIVFVTSIFTTGYAIGDFIWPVLYKLFLDAYSWRGTFLIQGALIANISVLALIQTSTWGKYSLQKAAGNEVKQHDIELEKKSSNIKDDNPTVTNRLIENHKDTTLPIDIQKEPDDASSVNRTKSNSNKGGFVSTDLS